MNGKRRIGSPSLSSQEVGNQSKFHDDVACRRVEVKGHGSIMIGSKAEYRIVLLWGYGGLRFKCSSILFAGMKS